MNTHDNKGLVSPSDIAELAGVSRAAVSNWRKRNPDFPSRVSGTDANPLFEKAQVIQWLRARGNEIQTAGSGAILWSAMNMLRGAIDIYELQESLLTLMSAKKISSQHDGKMWEGLFSGLDNGLIINDLLRRIFEVDSKLAGLEPRVSARLTNDQLIIIADVLDQIPNDELGSASDYVLEKNIKLQGKFGAEWGFVGSRISTLLALLAFQRPTTGVLYDPACGIASALISAVEFGAKPTQIIGQDISESSIYVAKLRAFLHGIDIEFVVSDVLQADELPDLKADTVILEPPFGLRFDSAVALSDPRFLYGTPPKTSADLAWVQDAISHLSDRGRGYVVTTLGSLTRTGAEQDIRTGLVRAGCVEAIISLPGKMLPHTSIPLALWVLRRPTNYAEEPITFIDASEETIPELLIPSWLDENSDVNTDSKKSVFASEVIASNSNLLPQNWVFREPADYEELEDDYTWCFEKIEVSLEESVEALEILRAPTQQGTTRVVTVEELLSQNVMKMHNGRTRPNDKSDSCFTNSHVRLGTQPTKKAPDSDRNLTSPRDVIVATINATTAVVDAVGGHEVANGLHHFTKFNEDILLSDYFALIISGSWNNRFQTGTAMKRANIRNLEIPLPPLEEQARLVNVISAAQKLEQNAKELLASAASLRNSILVGVRYGVGIEVADRRFK